MPLSIKEIIKTKLNSILRSAKLENPELGHVPDIEHNICLSSTSPIVLKPYTVPINKFEPIREELQR